MTEEAEKRGAVIGKKVARRTRRRSVGASHNDVIDRLPDSGLPDLGTKR